MYSVYHFRTHLGQAARVMAALMSRPSLAGRILKIYHPQTEQDMKNMLEESRTGAPKGFLPAPRKLAQATKLKLCSHALENGDSDTKQYTRLKILYTKCNQCGQRWTYDEVSEQWWAPADCVLSRRNHSCLVEMLRRPG